MGLTICLRAVIGIISLLAYNISFKITTCNRQNYGLCGLAFLVVHSFDVRSEKSIFETGIFANMYLLYSFIICTGAQVLVIGIPFLAKLFKVVPLTLSQWLVVAALSLVPLLISEIQKAFARKKQAVGLFGYENA